MPRRRLEPGEVGDFSEPKWNEEREAWQISCKIGEHIGAPSRVHASGPTKRKAKDNLKARVAEWKPKAAAIGAYDPNCTVAEAADAWLIKFEQHQRTRGQTAFTYRKELRRSKASNADPKKIVIAESDLGGMRASNVRPLHIRLHLATLNKFSTKQLLHKVILNHIFEMLVEDGVRDYNPVSSIKGYDGKTAPKRSGRRKEIKNPHFPDEPSPFTADEMRLFRQLEAEHFSPENCRRYPRRDPRFLDYTAVTYDLCSRPSETLALLFDDIDFATGEVLIGGTVVVAKLRVWQIQQIIADFALSPNDIMTKDLTDFAADDLVTATYRQPFGKTRESAGRVIVSKPTLDVLRRRRSAAPPSQRLIFPTQVGTLMRSSTMSETWQRVVAGTELDWSTPRTLRSTRATRVAEKYGIPAARLMLRHEENSPVTEESYVHRDKPAVNFTDAL